MGLERVEVSGQNGTNFTYSLLDACKGTSLDCKSLLKSLNSACESINLSVEQCSSASMGALDLATNFKLDLLATGGLIALAIGLNLAYLNLLALRFTEKLRRHVDLLLTNPKIVKSLRDLMFNSRSGQQLLGYLIYSFSSDRGRFRDRDDMLLREALNSGYQKISDSGPTRAFFLFAFDLRENANSVPTWDKVTSVICGVVSVAMLFRDTATAMGISVHNYGWLALILVPAMLVALTIRRQSRAAYYVVLVASALFSFHLLWFSQYSLYLDYKNDFDFWLLIACIMIPTFFVAWSNAAYPQIEKKITDILNEFVDPPPPDFPRTDRNDGPPPPDLPRSDRNDGFDRSGAGLNEASSKLDFKRLVNQEMGECMNFSQSKLRVESNAHAAAIRLLNPFKKSSYSKAIFELSWALLLVFVGIFLYFLSRQELPWSWLIAVGAVLFTAGGLVKLFTIQHDCGHGSFFPSDLLNKLTGRACSAFTLIPFLAWKVEHNEHHRRFSDLDRQTLGDVFVMSTDEYADSSLVKRIIYCIFRSKFFVLLIAPLSFLLIRNRIPVGGDLRQWKSSLLTSLVLISLYFFLVAFGGLELWFLLTSWHVAGMIGMLIFYNEHQFEGAHWSDDGAWNLFDAATYGSSVIRMPKFIDWITGSIGFHNIHHLAPKIPSYRIREAYFETRHAIPSKEIFWRQLLFPIGFLLWSRSDHKFVRSI